MIWKIMLITHILAGSLALICGTITAVLKKGTQRHRFSGKIFATSMLLVAGSALGMCVIKPNDFLMGIGFFTLYLTVSGWIYMRPLQINHRKQLVRLSGVLGFVCSIVLITNAFGNGVNLVLLVFAAIQMPLALEDLLSKPEKNKLRKHISRISGAYIAALTAFLVVNITFLPDLVIWLGPTLAGTLFITRSIRKYTLTD